MSSKTPYFVFVIGVLALFLAGCGGVAPNTANRPPLPASHGKDEFRPNFLGDLVGSYYFPQQKITYRIVTANAVGVGRDEKGQQIPLSFIVPDADQANAIRKGVASWATALEGLRTIEEVAGDKIANVDFVIRPVQDMPGANDGDDEDDNVLGHTDPWWPELSNKPFLGRSVIHLRGDLNNRDLEETSRHEAGHGLVGFWGHSRHVGDVMFPRRLWWKRVKGLSKYDTNSARANYSR